MSRDDWFRNKAWNDAIERSFNEKLARARTPNRPQYLRIQASYLCRSTPKEALKLLDRYFEIGGDFSRPSAHEHRAEAKLALDDIEGAISAYKDALSAVGSVGQAALDLPMLIGTRRIAALYQDAIEILQRRSDSLVFPLDHFRFHAAQALILHDAGERQEAQAEAQLALDWVSKKSPFQRHRELGLVGSDYDPIIVRLKRIVSG